ncbi:MAG: type II toxin-antitoxin system HicB family antitoxin [Candidatus Paceibacterota bacterium]|jgi:predicted RNase H-like HicB family nuclease
MKLIGPKTTMTYNAIFKPYKKGCYEVSFPDFPGCVTFGRTFAEAKRKAKEVLQLWIEELTEHGQKIMSVSIEYVIGRNLSPIPRRTKTSYATANC